MTATHGATTSRTGPQARRGDDVDVHARPVQAMPRLHEEYGDTFSAADPARPADRSSCSAIPPTSRRSSPPTPPQFHAGEGNEILKPVMGEHSVLLTDEAEHLRARKLLMPAFTGPSMRGYQPLVEAIAKVEVDSWRRRRHARDPRADERHHPRRHPPGRVRRDRRGAPRRAAAEGQPHGRHRRHDAARLVYPQLTRCRRGAATSATSRRSTGCCTPRSASAARPRPRRAATTCCRGCCRSGDRRASGR